MKTLILALITIASSVFAQATDSVTMSWSASPAPTAGQIAAQGYRLFWRIPTATYSETNSIDAKLATTATATNLDSKSVYLFVVKAYAKDAAGTLFYSAPSNEVTFAVLPTVPPPTNPQGTRQQVLATLTTNGPKIALSDDATKASVPRQSTLMAGELTKIFLERGGRQATVVLR